MSSTTPAGPGAGPYDPFDPGPLAVGVHAAELADPARGRLFPVQLWHPAAEDTAPLPGRYPLVIFSHGSGGNRRSSSFVGTHLASHGYIVAALDHSVVAPELARRDGEPPAVRDARIDATVASRVPDVRLLLDYLLGDGGAAGLGPAGPDPGRVGVAGHSFGGWTALAAAEADPRVRAVVAMGPGGSREPRPGILRLTLTFDWGGRDVPVLYLAAEDDVPIPPDAVRDLHDRTPGSKRMVVLRRADHQHFLDDVAGQHEALRAMILSGEGAWLTAAMRPASELCPAAEAHLFVRGLTLSHLDATLRDLPEARSFLAGDVAAALAARGVAAFAEP